MLTVGMLAAITFESGASAVEISFFAPVQISVDLCIGFDECSHLQSNPLINTNISGTIDIAVPLSDFSSTLINERSEPQLVHFGATTPFPFVATPGGGDLRASYTAPTALGEVGQLTIEFYTFGSSAGFAFASSFQGWGYQSFDGTQFFQATPQSNGPLAATTNFVYAIPEPATVVLLLTSVGGLISRRRS